eukprot:1904389-Pleurochrysis_carterae.AAC.2
MRFRHVARQTAHAQPQLHSYKRSAPHSHSPPQTHHLARHPPSSRLSSPADKCPLPDPLPPRRLQHTLPMSPGARLAFQQHMLPSRGVPILHSDPHGHQLHRHQER